MKNNYDAIALFSGGLDSILAVKVIEEQNLKVKCLHFVSPFFGKAHLQKKWEKIYKLDISCVDISDDFVRLLQERPEHGFGKMLNPCVDCKILLMRHAKQHMEKYGAQFIISGEVLGQRPMSQRRETLNIIRRESGLQELLLRPLSAKLFKPTTAETTQLVDREKLFSISGRGRKDQMLLAKHFNITDIPTPAGGCMLAEQENASRYLTVLTRLPNAKPEDFSLAHAGRQYWSEGGHGMFWLVVGRNAASNAQIQSLIRKEDYVFRLRDFAGPLAVGRYMPHMGQWDRQALEDAASFVASFSQKAVHAAEFSQSNAKVTVMMRQGQQGKNEIPFEVKPLKNTPLAWHEPVWEDFKQAKKINLGNDA